MSETRWKSPPRSTRVAAAAAASLSLEQLPAELLLHIISFLDHRSFSCLRGVSTQFRRLTDSATPQLSGMLVCAVLRYTNQTWTSARELYNHLPDSNPASEDVSLLMQTHIDIDQHFRLLSLRPAFWPLRSFARLCGAMHGHLREASGFTKELIYGRCELTENFAMLDICLRRDFCQLRAMFPTRPQPHDDAAAAAARLRSSGYEEPNMACASSPSASLSLSATAAADELVRCPELLITDDDARSAWVQAFGSQSVVDYDAFFNAVIVRRWPQAREHSAFEAYFRFYTNIPRDNIMTTYKWDAIVKQFGPCSHFFENFTQFGCGRGFLGPVNSVKADDILRGQPGYFILRVSRLEPERLTLSFCTKSSSGLKVLHRRKPHDLSIPQFVEKYLQSRSKTPFRPLRNQLDCSVASLHSFTDFLHCSQSFIRQLHPRSRRPPTASLSSSSVFPIDVARALS